MQRFIFYLLLTGCGLLPGRFHAQDTLVLNQDTLFIPLPDWDMLRQQQGKEEKIMRLPFVYWDTIRVFVDFYPKEKSVEQIVFGYAVQDSFVPHGPARYFFSDGELLGIRHYKHGVLEGWGKDFYENGFVKARMFFKAGVPEGFFEAFYEDETLMESGHFSGGLETGRWLDFYNNRKVRSISWLRDGHLHGPDSSFYENGALKAVSHYYRNRLNGRMRVLHRNGRPWTERVYERGNLVEVKFLHDREGRPLDQGSFSKGNGVLKIYNDNGVLIEEAEYEEGVLVREKRIDKK